MCYLSSEIWNRDYLGSNISSMSLSKPFSQHQIFSEIGQLIIWGL